MPAPAGFDPPLGAEDRATTATLTLLWLSGHVVLLLWGLRMVQSGVVRAFGSGLRRVLGRALHRRLVAVGAGLAVTALLQSSTATAMMTASFAADGTLALVPALAVMLGANMGTALVVKALSFDVSWLAPLLLIGGHAAHRGRKGRVHDLGRVAVGLGLVLLALHLLVQTIEPVQAAPVLGQLLSVLTGEPLLDLLFAAALTWAAHSSVAIMLLIVSLAATNVITPVAALALVLGANLGGAIPPLLEGAAANPAARRLPAGNLLFRALGCAVALPFVHGAAEWIWQRDPDPAAAVVWFHLGFNAVLAVALLGVLGPAARLLALLFPDRPPPADPARPLYLDAGALQTPYLALALAARETLRMADLAGTMLRRLHDALDHDREAPAEIVRTGKNLGRLHEAVRAFLARLAAEPLAGQDARRCGMVLDFAVALGLAGGILERSMAPLAARKQRKGLVFTPADRAGLDEVQGAVLATLALALPTFLSEDARSARELLDAKRRLNDREWALRRAHLARSGAAARPEAMEASTAVLSLLRDLRRINSLVSGIAYAVLDLGQVPEDETSPVATTDGATNA